MESRREDYESVIFLHIPKAAGTTLHHIIARQYPETATFGTDGGRRIPDFIKMPDARRRQIRCLKGHMPFGLHSYLAPPSTYITLLRDPLDRIISHYYFVLRSPWHDLYEPVTSASMTLEEYVESGITHEVSNDQTRLLSGHDNADLTRPDLEEAKANLQQYFAAVGLAERFDESLLLIKKRLGWSRVFYTKRNVTSNRPAKTEISESTVELIQESNQLDIELYEFARALFEETLRKEGASFRFEVLQFRLLNRVYSTTVTTCRRTRFRAGALRMAVLGNLHD